MGNERRFQRQAYLLFFFGAGFLEAIEIIMSYRSIFTIFLFSLMLEGCSVNKFDTKRYINKFSENKKDFEELVILLKSEKTITDRAGYSINENELNEEIRNKLDKLEIAEVSISYTHCQGVISIGLTTNWTKKATVYFTNDICDKVQTARGYYSVQSSGTIEVWGLGDDWLMLIDRDFI
jgi:hypothetical protein